MSNPTPPVKKRGCFFYGCLSLSILALVVALFVGVGIYFAKRTLDGWINDYTDTAPAKIETLVYPEEKMKELQGRINSFQQSLEQRGAPSELVLTADDLNALISGSRDMKGKVFVKIEDDQVKGHVSWPLPDVGPIKLKGRYLNGVAAFKPSIENGQLDVRIEQVTVKDKPIPPAFLDELKKQNIARDAQAQVEEDPNAAKLLDRIDHLEIRDGKIVIRGKTNPATPATQPATPAPAPAQP